MKSNLYLMMIAGAVLLGCYQKTETPEQSIPAREHSVQSVLWQQQSAEYKALCYQAYNLAGVYLDKALDQQSASKKPLAIITDIDETVLDNSPYNARMIEKDIEYSSATWAEWVKREEATSVPGAFEFFNYAASKGVKVFYISNRSVTETAETISNLKKLNYPYADSTHLLLKDQTSKKQSRRNIVLQTHEVIMYLGDNLSDFSEMFDGTDRDSNLDSIRSKLGFEYIVLPNPMYGDWETKGIYEGRYDWTSQQKDSIRRANLRSY